jgi:hypothetical protein
MDMKSTLTSYKEMAKNGQPDNPKAYLFRITRLPLV